LRAEDYAARPRDGACRGGGERWSSTICANQSRVLERATSFEAPNPAVGRFRSKQPATRPRADVPRSCSTPLPQCSGEVLGDDARRLLRFRPRVFTADGAGEGVRSGVAANVDLTPTANPRPSRPRVTAACGYRRSRAVERPSCFDAGRRGGDALGLGPKTRGGGSSCSPEMRGEPAVATTVRRLLARGLAHQAGLESFDLYHATKRTMGLQLPSGPSLVTCSLPRHPPGRPQAALERPRLSEQDAQGLYGHSATLGSLEEVERAFRRPTWVPLRRQWAKVRCMSVEPNHRFPEPRPQRSPNQKRKMATYPSPFASEAAVFQDYPAKSAPAEGACQETLRPRTPTHHVFAWNLRRFAGRPPGPRPEDCRRFDRSVKAQRISRPTVVQPLGTVLYLQNRVHQERAAPA